VITEEDSCTFRTSKLISRRKLCILSMAKRQAEETLELTAASDSPAPKKARIANGSQDHKYSQGVDPPSPTSQSSNEHRPQDDKMNKNHIMPAVTDGDQETGRAISPAPSTSSQEEESAYSAAARQTAPLAGYRDLYLDTIDRSVLDFDFEKLCSVTLSNINVYACLVCGKYYQGRGPKSHAYFHALDVGHHVFVNMQTKRVYVLPEGYEVKSKSLEDIKFVVDPKLSMDEVAKLDKEPNEALDLSGKKYRPGMCIPPIGCDVPDNGVRRLRRNE
jgi:U4/U6.U5 tri-snRNP-associated protein 2